MLDLVYPQPCPLCAQWLTIFEGPTCHLCRRDLCTIPVDHAPDGRPRWAAGAFEGTLRDAVLALKFRAELWRAPGLGRALALALHPLLPPVDLIVPVPLSRRRLRTRGFNQSALIARALARQLRRPLRVDALLRTRHDPPQAQRNALERATIAGAYACPRSARIRHALMGKRVLLVDDVTTTGHTAAACASALDDAGAAWVGLVSLAHAPPPSEQSS